MPTSSVNPLRVLIVQGGIGCCMLFGPERWTNLPAYKPALQLWGWLPFYPMRAWGVLLLVIAIGLSLALHRYGRQAWHWSAALAMFWGFWAWMYAAAVLGSGAGGIPVFFAIGFGWYAFERATPPRRRNR